MGYVCILSAFRDIYFVVNLVNKETEFGNICRRSQIYKLSPNQITTLKMYEQAWKLPTPNQAIATTVTLSEVTDPPCKWQLCYILLPTCISLLFQFSSRRYLYARKSPYVLHYVSQNVPTVAFEAVPMFIWMTITLSRPFKEDRRALLLSTPLFSASLLLR